MNPAEGRPRVAAVKPEPRGRGPQAAASRAAPIRSRLRRIGEACLWLLIILGALLAFIWVASKLRLVVLPVMLALVLTTFLEPPTHRLRDGGWPPAAAAAFTLLVFLTLFGGVLAVLVPQFAAEIDDLDVGLTEAVDAGQRWIAESPLPFSSAEVAGALEDLQQQVRDSAGAIAGQLYTGAVLALEVVVGLVLAVVVTFFLLKDGPRIRDWFVGLTPAAHRRDVRRAGDRAWTALGGFVRGQTMVALFDAILIGLALVILGVPLALPIAVLTFFGAFVPIIGAFVTGFIAVLIALVAEGLFTALLALAAIVFVQQVESNFFQPVVVGRAIRVHPLAILLGVTAGAVLAGIIGAMIAAPLVAVSAAVLSYMREGDDEAGPEAEPRPEPEPAT
jgi:predicted PurR-regulated permease PerM